MRLRQLSLPDKCWLLFLKYAYHAARMTGLRLPLKIHIRGRAYRFDNYRDVGFLVYVFADISEELETYGLHGERGLVLVDVGAHHGETALAWSLMLPGSHIMSFEPNPACAENARGNTSGFDVEVQQVGLSDRDGREAFRLDTRESATSSFDWHRPNTGPQLEIRRGDDLLRSLPRIDLIKVDVEGYELHVLSGLAETLRRCERLRLELSIDRTKDHAFWEIAQLLAASGLELVRLGTPHIRSGRQTDVDMFFIRRTSPR